MSSMDGLGLGYQRVDDDPNFQVLLDNMDATAGWVATVELRAWEREHLRLAAGERLLDLGCGLGEAARALAPDLGPSGEVVGIDASAAMLAVATRRWDATACPARFDVGDAMAIAEPSDSFDAARSERMLQWVADPAAVVRELARVLRPGGRISLIDTDWSTFRLDVGDAEVSTKVQAAMGVERSRPSLVGGRLRELAEAAGFEGLETTEARHLWTHWDPDVDPSPIGCFSMATLAADLVSVGELAAADVDGFVATVHDAARRGEFSMALTMFAVAARLP